MPLPLSINGLSKRFRRMRGEPESHRLLFSDVSFTIADGQVVCVHGPNGSGKTTLLKMIAGLVLPDSGRIAVFEQTAGSMTARRLAGLFCEDDRAFYWRLSARRSLSFFGALFDLSAQEVERRIAPYVELLSLQEWMDTPFARCSTGIRRRFGLLRVLLHRPRLLLLDEPERSLDTAGCVALGELIAEYLAAERATVLFTTPNPQDPVIDATGSMRIVDHKLERCA